ncbi:MAG: argininosuccinate lyase [Anaerolineae bacterium]
MSKLWGGVFRKETNELMERFNASLHFDRRLYAFDIQGSIAYARALERAGLITAQERVSLIQGLEQVRREFEAGVFQVQPSDEDIHTAVERRLGELVGPVAGVLHTGRSRNDQVATDVRLYLLDKIASLRESLLDLRWAIVDKAEGHLDVIMPGYTHLQQAQPVLFSHWLMSYFWMFQRDRGRLNDLERRVSVLPLGAGALAGTPLRIDRALLAEELGFDAVAENSMDAVSDRDYLIEFLSWASITQIHLSRLAEDLIIWSSREFGFVEVDQAYATGSSIMPQKVNPDSLELLRGKAGRMVGHLVAILTVMKGLPSTYDKDMQEDKEPLFDAIDTLEMALPITAGIICTLKIKADRMAAALEDEILATDLADYLVRKGVPFREAHALVGQVVRRALERGNSQALRELRLEDFRAISQKFEADVYEVFDFRRSVEMKSAPGGTATEAVREQIKRARSLLAVEA